MSRRPYCLLAAALAAVALSLDPSPATGGSRPSLGLGGLSDLALKKPGRAMHEGSWDRRGGNADMRVVKPGETLTLLDTRGAGVVRRFWVTIAPRSERTIHRQAILRMYWDGEPHPSVEVPIGDFFGVGFGEQQDYMSLPLNQTSGGYNCYWPMPFHKSARWTLTNLSSRQIDAFYYNIDFTTFDRIPADVRHFHAQWRRENPTKPGVNYTILEAAGKGHFVGTAMFMQNRRGRGLGFLEGDEMVYVDGESQPSIIGTGTEDYFSSGWYYDRGLYSAPYHGINIKDTGAGRISTYRWHIEDVIPFKKSLRVTIEHGHNNESEGDYSSIAYWYQNEPHATFPRLPDPEALLPLPPAPVFRLPGAIEGESLLRGASATSGEVVEQDMSAFDGRWSGTAHLWWLPRSAPQTLTLSLPAPAAGEYEVIGHFTKAPDYGAIRILIGDRSVGPDLNLYDPRVVASGPVSLGRVTLQAGPNRVLVRLLEKDPRSTGFLVGIDAIELRR